MNLVLVLTTSIKADHLWVGDDGAAAAEPLAAGPVLLGRLARGSTEPVNLVPAQQSLSLQNKHRPGPELGSDHMNQTWVSGPSWRTEPQSPDVTLATRGASGPVRRKKAFLRSIKVPLHSSSTAARSSSPGHRTEPNRTVQVLTTIFKVLILPGSYPHPDRTEPGSVLNNQSEQTPSAGIRQNRVSPEPTEHLEDKNTCCSRQVLVLIQRVYTRFWFYKKELFLVWFHRFYFLFCGSEPEVLVQVLKLNT